MNFSRYIKAGGEGYGTVAQLPFKDDEVIGTFKFENISSSPKRLTIQLDENKHGLINPKELLSMNHSCDPNILLDLKGLRVIALRDINKGEELRYFYPSTEWDMDEKFVCECGETNCLGFIGGARYITEATLKKYTLSPYMYEKLAKEDSSSESFDPRSYLEEYFLETGDEYDGLYNFWWRSANFLKPTDTVLEVGVGPTLYSTIPLVPHVARVDLSDYVTQSFEETNRWLGQSKERFDWSEHIQACLRAEGMEGTPEQVLDREKTIRSKIGRRLKCNMLIKDPIEIAERYNCVTAHYCTEAACSDFSQWQKAIENLASLLLPGGMFLLSVTTNLKRLRRYGDQVARADAPNITQEGVLETLKNLKLDSELECEFLPAPADRPYDGTVLVRTRKGS